ncbi:DUF3891 family protein [Granulicella sibirica]|uniref:DUF3891 family protein n=1 Tax=Granulicella sibirica TaxID=2479048 RepID=A0A4Q0T5C5_9BACT|nr:DUF3891 family protein [Granulicella sibirica]RXH57820.1 hypothetical protein GRAN_1130 [Granulicella sibirica]
MLRLETETGFWLITHPDHAHLAAAFATHWGNDLFLPPSPRSNVLHGIEVHDDGWIARDARPQVTRAGKPSAFSSDLVGKYSAFEEIDLADYLAVRESAVQQVEAVDPYAALLVSMHTYNLLTARADRSTIAPEHLPLLDAFLERQKQRQQALRKGICADPQFLPADVTDEAFLNNFRLLQATDNLSLLSSVDYSQPATLLHPLPAIGDTEREIRVTPIGPRQFRLDPYPFDSSSLTFPLPARHVSGHTFAGADQLTALYQSAPVEQLEVAVTA